MATRSKPATTAAAKPAAKPVAKSTAAETPAPKRTKAAAAVGKDAAKAPFLRFYLSAEMQHKVDAVLAQIEESPEPASHGEALADLVVELTDAGMNYFYLRALKSAQVGFVVEQSARLALSGAASLISSVCRRYIVRMDDAQLAAIARHIRELAR